MGKFSEEEVRQLKGNVNVAFVSEREVSFTADFKQLAWEEKQRGKNMPTIFRENGIAPEVLGRKRVENFAHRLREAAISGNFGMDDQREEKKRSMEEKIRRLEHELAYTRQEVEFLKKLQMANMEARREWESKHRPK